MNSHILLGISGGIAAIKIPDLLTLLYAQGITADVIETESATRLLPPENIQKITGSPVYTTMYPTDFDPSAILKKRSVEHIRIADRAGMYVIAPATANCLAKLAAGIADDYLTTVALAVTCPVLICPSMNTHMWQHPATQKNVRILKSLGYHILPPDRGSLACGYDGEGRLPSSNVIADEITGILSQRTALLGLRVVVTAGGTTENIDEVRTISNRSSGKMGIAIAEACFLAGAAVTLLRAKTSVESRYGIGEFTFETTGDLEALLDIHIPQSDICFHVAAVSDFSVQAPLWGKHSSKHPITVQLEPRKKLLDHMKHMNPSLFLVAFKAEYGLTDTELVTLATHRMEESGADMIIANDVGKKGIGFQSDTNEVILIAKHKKAEILPRASKTEIAQQIVTRLCALMESGRESR